MCTSGSSNPSSDVSSSEPVDSTEATCAPSTPLHCQETPMSCGIASSRMVIDTLTGNNVDEATLRQQSQNYPGAYTDANGTRMDNITELLHANGVPNASNPLSGQTYDDLQAATASGNPAIIHFNNAGGGGHFMVLDEVRTNDDGTKTFIIRDPWCGDGPGGRREMSEQDMADRGYSGWAVTTNP